MTTVAGRVETAGIPSLFAARGRQSARARSQAGNNPLPRGGILAPLRVRRRVLRPPKDLDDSESLRDAILGCAGECLRISNLRLETVHAMRVTRRSRSSLFDVPRQSRIAAFDLPTRWRALRHSMCRESAHCGIRFADTIAGIAQAMCSFDRSTLRKRCAYDCSLCAAMFRDGRGARDCSRVRRVARLHRTRALAG
jgi:hypothetical protein